MQATKEVLIKGESASLQRFPEQVEHRLRNGWKRDRLAEERLGRHGVRGPWDCCFSCSATDQRSAAGLWLHARDPYTLYISSVIPLDERKFTEEEANSLLLEFHREFVLPAAAEVGADARVVDRAFGLEHALTPEGARSLKSFSASASRSELQATDRTRWEAFIVQAHRHGSTFDIRLLDDWLRADGWPVDIRHSMIQEYEKARSLLTTYDESIERQ